MTKPTYQFFQREKTADELVVEIAELELKLIDLLTEVLNEDISTQNPKLASDIADVEKKLAASKKALEAAGKLSGDKGKSHTAKITAKREEYSKRLKMLKSKGSEINSGAHIGKGVPAKEKYDAEKAAERKSKNAANKEAAKARVKELAAERKAKKAADKEAKAAKKMTQG